MKQLEKEIRDSKKSERRSRIVKSYRIDREIVDDVKLAATKLHTSESAIVRAALKIAMGAKS